MRDEDSNEKIKCMFCGSTDDCEHLLAILDRSFNECCGGYLLNYYYQFQYIVEKAFSDIEKNCPNLKPSWDNYFISELWNKKMHDMPLSNYPVSVDEYILSRLIKELLTECGGYEYMGPIAGENEDIPGFSSALTIIYAENPKSVYENALLLLEKLCKSFE